MGFVKNNKNYYFIVIIVLVQVISFPGIISSQENPIKINWDSWKFLIGEWVGEGGGNPGQGTGGFTFYPDLQNRILIRKNFANYPPTNNNPAFRHDDLMIIYQENDSTKAIYFDNEGHVINYSISFSENKETIVFLGEVKLNSPTFRMTYIKIKEDKVKILFEIAPPGNANAFSLYIEAYANKK